MIRYMSKWASPLLVKYPSSDLESAHSLIAIMLPSDFTHIQDERNTWNSNRTSRPSFSDFRFNAAPEPPEHDVSRNHSTAAYSTTELNSRTWQPTPEPSTPMEDKPRSDSTTLCYTPHIVKAEKGPIVTELAVEENFEEEEPASFMRKVCVLVFDLATAVASLCFMAFAVLAHPWDETPASEYQAQTLFRAAKIVCFSTSSSMLPLTVARARRSFLSSFVLSLQDLRKL